MKKPSDENLLHQLNRLEKWCIAYREENPRNHGTYRGGVCRDTYKPLRDGIVFYSSGWGWRLRKNWQQAIADKRVELQAKHDRLVAWFKGESASNKGLQADGAVRPAEVIECGNCGVPRFVHGGILEACPNCGDDETDLAIWDDVP